MSTGHALPEHQVDRISREFDDPSVGPMVATLVRRYFFVDPNAVECEEVSAL